MRIPMKWIVLYFCIVSFCANSLSASQDTFEDRGRLDFFANALYYQQCTPGVGCWGGRGCGTGNHWRSNCPIWGFSLEADYVDFFDLPGFDYGTFSAAAPGSTLPLSTFVPLGEPRPWNLENDHANSFLPTLWLTFFIPHTVCYAPRISFFGSLFWRERTEEFSGAETLFLTLPFVDGSDVFTIGTPSTAPFSFSGSLERDYKYRLAGMEFRETIPWPTCGIPTFFEPFLLMQVNQFQQNYTFELLFNSADFHLSEELHTVYGDFGGGVALGIPFSRCFTLLLEGKALASFAHTRLHAGQDFSGAIVHFHDKHDQAGGKFSGRAGLYYNCKCFTLGAIGSYEYWTYLPKVVNPHFDVEPAKIEKHHLKYYTAGLELSMVW